MTRRDLLLGSALFLQKNSLDEALHLLESQTKSGEVSAATLFAGRGSNVVQKAFGKAPAPNAVFLLASITKPMTATAVMLLCDRGELSLSDSVQRFIPEFRGGSREKVLIQHLLTHSSGLPDMLPGNTDLRKRHAPLSDFVAGTCRTPLLFTPGTQVRYQSMGILLASEIVSRITKQPFPDFLKQQIFRPLGMGDTSLGLGGRAIAATMQCQVPEPSGWDWNSTYWRNLASPWGGAHSTVYDIARFLHYFAHPDNAVLKPGTAASMITEHASGWGFGWALNGAKFGRGCSPATFGHGGSTGTLCWLDPKSGTTFVLLTTKPADVSNKTLLHPVADLVSTSA